MLISLSISPPALSNSFSLGANANNSSSSAISRRNPQHGDEHTSTNSTAQPEHEPKNPGIRTQQADANSATRDTTKGTPATQELSDSDRRLVEELQTRDREVRAHEAAHKAAAGSLARGAASFSYEQGPGGRRYAVGGEVSIDTSPVSGDPQATLQKAQTIRAAALAPAQPSNTDRAVAAKAGQMAASARAEIAAEPQKNTTETEKPAQNNNQDGNETITPQQAQGIKKGADIYQQSANPTISSEFIGKNLNVSV